jgi:hypothetical protein
LVPQFMAIISVQLTLVLTAIKLHVHPLITSTHHLINKVVLQHALSRRRPLSLEEGDLAEFACQRAERPS